MRFASVDELDTGCSTARWSSPGRAENDRTGKANELVRSLVGTIKKEEDVVVASDSKSELWRDLSLKRAKQKLEHEICRHREESSVRDKSVHQQ